MSSEDRRSSRRSFLDRILGLGFAGLAAAVLYPVIRYLVPPARGEPGARSVVLDPTNPDQVDPETRVFVFGNKPGILVRGPAGEWKAFSAICTHLSCTVRYKADTHQIWCPCHNGMFDLNGRNLPGTPPPKPLEEFRVSERPDGTVVVRRS
jgi:cytochrome b6-f complex iron-sulfur subunit